MDTIIILHIYRYISVLFQIKSSDGLPLTLCVSCVQRLNRRHLLQMTLKHNNAHIISHTNVQTTTGQRECNKRQQILFSSADVQLI